MTNTRDTVSYTPWAPDVFESSQDFNLDTVIRASLYRDYTISVSKPTHLAETNKTPKPRPADLHYNIPSVYRDNINLLKHARAVHSHNLHIQSKINSEPIPKYTDLAQPPIPQLKVTHSTDNISFTQTHPRFDENTIYLISKKAASLTLLNAGFTNSKSSALNKLVDALVTYLSKFGAVLKSNYQPDEECDSFQDCVDPLEQTLIELGTDGYAGLFEFWQENVISYRQKLAVADSKLQHTQEGLIRRATGDTEPSEAAPGAAVEMSSIEVAAHGSLLEDSQGSNESLYSDEKPANPSKRIRLN